MFEAFHCKSLPGLVRVRPPPRFADGRFEDASAGRGPKSPHQPLVAEIADRSCVRENATFSDDQNLELFQISIPFHKLR